MTRLTILLCERLCLLLEKKAPRKIMGISRQSSLLFRNTAGSMGAQKSLAQEEN